MKTWKSNEQERFKELYPHFTNKFMVIIFNRTELSIKRKAQKLGLRKIINPSYFSAGYEPFNKGKTGLNNRDKGALTNRRRSELRNKYRIKNILAKLKAHSAKENNNTVARLKMN